LDSRRADHGDAAPARDEEEQNTTRAPLGKLSERLRSPATVLAGIGLLLLILSFSTRIRGDGVAYYAYLPAVVVYGSLDMHMVFSHVIAANVPVYSGTVSTVLPNGMTADFKPVGSAVLALPFYLVMRLLMLGGGLVTGKAGPDPTVGLPYQLSFTMASLFYLVVALALIYMFIRRRWGSSPAMYAIAAVLFATPLAAYSFFDPSYSHTFSVFTITAFALLVYQTSERRSLLVWALLGVMAALIVLVHYQEGLFILLMPAEGIWLISRRRWVLRELLGYLVSSATFGICLLPQMVVNRVIFDRWLPTGAPDISFNFGHPHLIDMLFSTHHGWIAWSPIVVIAFLGLPLAVRMLGWLVVALIAIGLLDVYLNASLSDWYGGSAFGARRLTDQTLLLAIGFAALFDWLAKRRVAVAAPVLTAFGVGWTVLLMARFYYIPQVDAGLPWSGFMSGTFDGIQYIPRLFFQGTVIRDVASLDFVGAAATTLALAATVVLALGGTRLAATRLSI
jgi:hypothetical protein